MNRMTIGFGAAAAIALLTGTIPASATTTSLAPQSNVRHVANLPGSTGGHVAIEGDLALMGNYGVGMTLYDVSDPAAPVQVGEYRPASRVVADAVPDATVIGGKTIAVLGGTNRVPSTQTTDFLDVTDPANPVVLQTLTGATDGEAHNADLVDGRGLYLPSGGLFRVYDATPLASGGQVTKLFQGDPRAMWASSPFRGQNEPQGPAFTHIHDIEIYTDYRVLLPEDQWVDQDGDGEPDPTYDERDIALVAEGGNYELPVLSGIPGVEGDNGGIYVIDITDPSAPVVMERWRLEANRGQGPAREPIRYYHEVQFLESDPRTMIVSDEDLHTGTCRDGGLVAVSIDESLTQATTRGEWFIPADDVRVGGATVNAPVCSAHVFSSTGTTVFMGSYNGGLQVIDFSDPDAPESAGEYIAEGANSWGAKFHEGYVYVGDFGGRGLDVFEYIPDPDGKAFLEASSPTSAVLGGVSELAAGCDPEADTQVDGFLMRVPAGFDDGSHYIRLWSSGIEAATDLDLWFYDSGCELINDTQVESGEPIPAESAWVWVDMFTGDPQWVYAKYDA